MRSWVRRTVLLGVAVLVTAAVGVMPAAAGGPTSVLLSAPGIGKVVATGYEDPKYNELQQLLDVGVPSNAETGGDDRSIGGFIRATWLIHDMSVWRLDIIYPDAPGGPWIATTEDQGMSGQGLNAQPVWHRSINGARLTEVLGSLGLLDKDPNHNGWGGGPTGPPQTDPSGPVVVEQPATVDQPAAAPTGTVKAEQGALTGWRWIIPGVILGAAAALLATRLLPKRRHWELIDAE